MTNPMIPTGLARVSLMNRHQNGKPTTEYRDAMITAFALGQLPEQEAERVKQWLIEQPELQVQVDEVRQFNHLIKREWRVDESITDSTILRDAILARLDPSATQTSSAEKPPSLPHVRWRFGQILWVAAAIAGSFVVAGVWYADSQRFAYQRVALENNREQIAASRGRAVAVETWEQIEPSGDESLAGNESYTHAAPQTVIVDSSSADPNTIAALKFDSFSSMATSLDGRDHTTKFHEQTGATPAGTDQFGRSKSANLSADGAAPAQTQRYYSGHHFILDMIDSEALGVVEFEAESARYGTEQYGEIYENDFRTTRGDSAISTFAVDVDTASYANVRRFLNQSRLPPSDAVRIEELVNYFPYNYVAPTGKVPFSVNMEVASCPWNPEHQLLRVGLKGKEIHRDRRPPGNLVFLLDVSGSMGDANKLDLLRQAMTILIDQLSEDDRIAIVTYAGDAGVHLEPTRGDQKTTLRRSINELKSGGSTNGSAGIEVAYQLATEHFIEEGTNRVILATDGDLNVGITQDDDLVRLISEKAATGVFLTVLGFGTGNLKDAKMEKLADRGNGQYAYIDSLREAQKVLIEEMSGSLVTIAKDVKLQIEFNPAQVAEYRLIGYENRVLQKEDFADDSKDAGDIGAGHTVTALYELAPTATELASRQRRQNQVSLRYQRRSTIEEVVEDFELTDDANNGDLLTLSLRWKEPDQDVSQLKEFEMPSSKKAFGRASKDFQFASAVAAFGMLLRDSRYRGNASWDSITEIASAAIGNDESGYRAEFVDLVRMASRLKP